MWFSGVFFLILSLIVEVYLWWKLQASLIFLSGRTCTIGGWLNTFLPHCMYVCMYVCTYIHTHTHTRGWTTSDFLKSTFMWWKSSRSRLVADDVIN